jgi:signal transduction histidine kinase
MKTREAFLKESGLFPDAGIPPEGVIGADGKISAPPSLRRDIAIVIAITVAVAFITAWLELNETFYTVTRRWEFLQLDEWPTIALTLTLCMIWMSWRRYGQVMAQLTARRTAEMRLAGALAENRRLAAEHVRALETERKHLARELHDELSQYSNAIKLDATALRASAGSNGAAQAAERILKVVDHMHAVTGNIIRRLRPAGLDELGLVAALENCVDQWRGRMPDTRLQLSVAGNFDDMGELAKLTVYRLVQEGLTNSSRHAQARNIDITLYRETASGDQILLTISDDGRGVELVSVDNGFGLSGMRERVELLGGSFQTQSQPGSGFTIEVALPFQKDEMMSPGP